MSFLKKTLGLFVEFDETQQTKPENSGDINAPRPVQNVVNQQNVKMPSAAPVQISAEDLDKFGKHFDKLLEEANINGVDYYEFWKMMGTLENHIPDENARIAAVFASLSIQGLTKQKLLESVNYFVDVMEKDKTKFANAIDQKSAQDILAKEQNVKQLEAKVQENALLIQKLTKEITEAQVQMDKIKSEVNAEKAKIEVNKKGYLQSFEAIVVKMKSDYNKFNSTL